MEANRVQDHTLLNALQTGAVELKTSTGFENATKEQIIEHYKRVCESYAVIIRGKEAEVLELTLHNKELREGYNKLQAKDYVKSDERLVERIAELEEEIATIARDIAEYAERLSAS